MGVGVFLCARYPSIGTRRDGGGVIIARVRRGRPRERDFFIDNLLVRIHFIIVMIKWTGLAPWETLL